MNFQKNWVEKTTYTAENRLVTICDRDDYRFGFNGMEKDNEVKGSGNSLDFGARIYDSRLGRFLSLDPKSQDFPWQSPYSAMDNCPILKSDPTGASGVARIKGNTIVIHATNYYYGRGVTPELAKADAKNIQDAWNGANAIKVINGKTYKVQFKIDYKVINDPGKGDAARDANKNPDKNYIAVGREGAVTNTRTSTNIDDKRVLGGNQSEYNRADLGSDNNTSAHEMGHGWGWSDANGVDMAHNDYRNSDGSPNIMQDRNSIMPSEYSDRKVTQDDVDKLNINWEELGEKGKTTVGEVSSEPPNNQPQK